MTRPSRTPTATPEHERVERIAIAAVGSRDEPWRTAACRLCRRLITGYNETRIMPVIELMASSGLGSLLGMRHALEPDHLAAVSTLVTGERSSSKAAFLGACWGSATVSLIAVGTALVLLRTQMPVRVSEAFEFLVALMLVGLGLRAIYLASRQGPAGPVHVHHHGTRVHVHQGRRRTSTSAPGRWPAGRSWSARFTASPAAAR
jgi:hypothetical protein